jgi:DNA sulfur modification protein DndD
MKLVSINLKNIGPFFGEHHVEFESSVEKPIILIGGVNGAGKTTLLNSIKIGLFGSYSFGFSSNNISYFRKIGLMQNEDSKNVDKNFEIEIVFTLTEKFNKNVYKSKRSWNSDNDDIFETHRLFKNNKELKNEMYESTMTKLKSIFPPSVIDASLFDGEKIGRVIEEDNLTDYLKNIFYANFSLDKYEKLNSDLGIYLQNAKSNNLLPLEANKLLDTEAEIKNLINTIKVKEEQLLNTTRYLKDLSIQKKIKTNEFENYGGITNLAKESLKFELLELEKKEKKSKVELNNYIEDLLPFHIAKNTLFDLKNQLEMEKPVNLLSSAEMINNYLGDSQEMLKVINQLKKMQPLSNPIINAHNNVLIMTESILSEIEKYERKLELNRINNENGYYTRKQLMFNLDNSEIQRLFDEIEELNQLEKYAYEQVATLKIEIEELRRQHETKLTIAKEYERLIQNRSNELSSFRKAKNLIKTSNEFLERIKQSKLNSISKGTLEIYNSALHKSNFLSSIVIEKDFKLNFKDNIGNEKKLESFSMGEKQILLASFIYSIYKESKRDTLFIFDTPLARLDKSNRKGFINEILNNISTQVIVLSTDSEFTKNEIEFIKDKLSNRFLLKHNPNLRRTNILRGEYFND